MSISLLIITELILIVTIFRIVALYRYKSLFNSGLIFCVTWVLSLPSYYLISNINPISEAIYPEFVDELNFFILFTASCFLYTTFIGKRRDFERSRLDLENFNRFYKPLVLFGFLSVLVYWYLSGASFSLAGNRADYVKKITENFTSGRQEGGIYSILSIFMSILIPCSVYMGYALSKWVFEGRRLPPLFWLVLPILSYFLYSAAIGGRNPLFLCFKYYIFGFGIGSSFSPVRDNLRKTLLCLIVFFIGINLYSTFVAKDRASYQKYDQGTERFWADYPLLGSFSGLVEYLSFHYIGYQYRRVDYVDDKLTYGTKTFGGILKYKLPFSSLVGVDSKLGDFFDKKNLYYLQDIMYSDRSFSVITASTYLLMYDDFGFMGSLIVILALVLFSQRLYHRFLSGNSYKFIHILPVFIMWIFWSNTIFDSYFSTENFVAVLYPILIIDFFLTRYRSASKSQTFANK